MTDKSCLPSELWKWDAVDIAQSIKFRTVSSREVVVSCLARLDAVNPKINAVVVRLGESALAEAEAADTAVARGDVLGPMHGVPVTIKINVDQIGQATSNGVVGFKGVIAMEDSPVVANFRAAGAIILGRTNTPAFSASWFTDSDLYGRTLNPWSKDHTAGGPSGGASASMAAGITPIGHGNDLAGSVRYPAYCTGVAGLRPSFGRIPAFIPSAKSERGISGQLMSVQGPLARHIRDIRLALSAMAKEDPRDPWWVPAPLEWPQLERPIRVAISAKPATSDVHPAVVEAVKRAGTLLAEAGYQVEEVDPPNFAEVAAEWTNLVRAEAPFFTTKAIEEFGDKLIRDSHRWQMEGTGKPDPAAYMQSLARRTGWIRRWNLFMRDYPPLLCPVSFEPPFQQGRDTASSESSLFLREVQMPNFTIPVLGLPAISVPTGTPDGLPMGVQIVAPRFREDLLLDAAEIIEARWAAPANAASWRPRATKLESSACGRRCRR
jgi:amidase